MNSNEQGDFEEIFELTFNPQLFSNQVINGDFRRTRLRSVIWRYLLGCLGEFPAEFSEKSSEFRKEYEELCKLHPINQLKSDEEKDCLNQINLDLARTMPGDPFFERPDVVELMRRVLFISSIEFPSVRYQQGMHELLALIVYLNFLEYPELEKDQENDVFESRNLGKSIYWELTDRKYIEHDSFSMFKKLMEKMEKLYRGVPEGAPRGTLNPVTELSQRISEGLLREKDPELHEFLVGLGIEPQVYMMKWLRLLFFREFHIQDVMVLWDFILASVDFELSVSYIVVSMLVFVRFQVITDDFARSLKRILKFPPVEDMEIIIRTSVELQEPGITVRKLFPERFLAADAEFERIREEESEKRRNEKKRIRKPRWLSGGKSKIARNLGVKVGQFVTNAKEFLKQPERPGQIMNLNSRLIVNIEELEDEIVNSKLQRYHLADRLEEFIMLFSITLINGEWEDNGAKESVSIALHRFSSVLGVLREDWGTETIFEEMPISITNRNLGREGFGNVKVIEGNLENRESPKKEEPNPRGNIFDEGEKLGIFD